MLIKYLTIIQTDSTNVCFNKCNEKINYILLNITVIIRFKEVLLP